MSILLQSRVVGRCPDAQKRRITTTTSPRSAMNCALIAMTLVVGTANAQTLQVYSADYRDANGWNGLPYGTTVMLGDVNGDGKADFCGRGSAGIYCSLSLGNGLGRQYLAAPYFSDSDGWANIIYYGSIRLGDVNGDGRADVCGRAQAGIVCALSNGLGFGAPVSWSTGFRDADGWGRPEYATTIMLGDINGDRRADVCGRGVAGIYCALSTGSAFNALVHAQPVFSDANGWNQRTYYGSIKLADVNGDNRADVCGRGVAGIYCALSTGESGTFGAHTLWTAGYRNLDGWTAPEYGSTIMFGDLNGDKRADVCGRGVEGLYCSFSNGANFTGTVLASDFLNNTNGWAHEIYNRAIRLGDLNGDGRADICARGGSGAHCGLSTVVFK